MKGNQSCNGNLCLHQKCMTANHMQHNPDFKNFGSPPETNKKNRYVVFPSGLV